MELSVYNRNDAGLQHYTIQYRAAAGQLGQPSQPSQPELLGPYTKRLAFACYSPETIRFLSAYEGSV